MTLHRLRPVPPSEFTGRNARLAELEAERAELLRQQAADIEARIADIGRTGRIALSVQEAADLCGVTYMTIRKWIAGGLPVSRPLGGDRLVMRQSLIEWLERWR